MNTRRDFLGVVGAAAGSLLAFERAAHALEELDGCVAAMEQVVAAGLPA